MRIDGSGHVFFRYTVGFVLTADGVVCTLAATWLRCLHVGYVLVSWACEWSGSVCDGMYFCDGRGEPRYSCHLRGRLVSHQMGE